MVRSAVKRQNTKSISNLYFHRFCCLVSLRLLESYGESESNQKLTRFTRFTTKGSSSKNQIVLCLAPHDTQPFDESISTLSLCGFCVVGAHRHPLCLLIHCVDQMRKRGKKILIYLSPAHVRMFTPLNRLQFILCRVFVYIRRENYWALDVKPRRQPFAYSFSDLFPAFGFAVVVDVFTLYRYKR